MNFRRKISAILGIMMAPVGAAAVAGQGFDGYIESPMRMPLDIYVDSPDWRIFHTKAYCYASVENNRGVLLVGYDRRQNRGHIAFWNRDITSYQSGDTTNLEIIVINIIPGVGPGEPNRDRGLQKFVIAVNQDGQRVFNSKLAGAEMLNLLSRFDRLVFVTADGKFAQNFELSGSAKALNHLRGCTPSA